MSASTFQQNSAFLIVGLGNPGKDYAQTRHNIGFRVIDAFFQKNEFPDFYIDKKSQCLISEKYLGTKHIILAKPQNLMNNSGLAVRSLYTKYQIQNTRCMVVIHDDIDLPVGKIKIVKNRGSAGHKGVESIIKELGTKDFVRLRVGIQPERGKPRHGEEFVLRQFTKEELQVIENVIEQSREALETILQKGVSKTMNQFNK
ncbi:MAG: aminoacyl-tRNA hydrolase [Patescibacteria group bacterium]